MKIIALFASVLFLFGMKAAAAEAKLFRAGAALVDISPTNFPVIVNAMFTERSATQTVDRLHAQALVLDDGATRVAIVVVDTCMMPRDLIDRAKRAAGHETGIPTRQMLVSATHTHSAPAAMGCLGSRADTNYAAFLPGKIAEAIVRANQRLRPAEIGWAVVDDWEHTFNRRWIRRPDRLLEDPFGQRTVRAHMHPGHESPDVTGPSGPVDPALSVIAIRARGGEPLALLANYSQHYYESALLSSDYFGRFGHHVAEFLGATNRDGSFVGMMSQGTSGDLMWMDYGAPRKQIGYDAYAREIAVKVHEAYRKIRFAEWVPLRVAERKIPLGYRVPTPERLAWARKVVATLDGKLPKTLPEIYALEAIYLHERPATELLLQAMRIGDLGIAAIPNEVYALTGLKLKARSPLQPTINIELANGAEGYIPPPEQHHLGGYTTWPARTAGLETGAEPRIVETLLSLLEEVSGQPRRASEISRGPYARAVLASRPEAYWRFEEMVVPVAHDSSGNENHGTYEDGVALYLPGPGSGDGVSPNPVLKSSNFSGPGEINRAAHFAGGWVRGESSIKGDYSVELWFWNALEGSTPPIAAHIFSRGGDQLSVKGKIIYSDKSARTGVIPRKWHHLVFVRAGRTVTVYLNGAAEISTEMEIKPAPAFFVGENFEGKIDEVAMYAHALSAAEITAHYRAAGLDER